MLRNLRESRPNQIPVNDGSSLFDRWRMALEYFPRAETLRCTNQPIWLSAANTYSSVAQWQLLLIRACIHQGLILTLCFRQTKMSSWPAAMQLFVTNAVPDGRGRAVPSDLNGWLIAHSSLSPRGPAWMHQSLWPSWKMASSCLVIRADKAQRPGCLRSSCSLWELQVWTKATDE